MLLLSLFFNIITNSKRMQIVFLSLNTLIDLYEVVYLYLNLIKYEHSYSSHAKIQTSVAFILTILKLKYFSNFATYLQCCYTAILSYIHPQLT